MESQAKEFESPLPLMIPDDERQIIDSVILDMAAHVRRLNVKTDRILKLNDDDIVASKLDDVISAGFKKLRDGKKIEDMADKLLDRIMRVSVDGEDPGGAIGMIFIRFYDTMNYIVAWKGKFRGVPCHMDISKETAREKLRLRKLL
jgi:hypothetical protein